MDQPKVFLNGKFVSEDQAVVSVFDRGFLYGDGLFETIRVLNGTPFRWEQHMQRLETGLEFLQIKPALNARQLRDAAHELIALNKMADSLLRVTISRGVGRRGYSPKGAEKPSVVLSVHPAPATAPGTRWKLITSSVRLPASEPLARYKTCSKLPQILARMEADAVGADEALLCNTESNVVEGASSNLFWVAGNCVCTPSLPAGILPGVTRAVVLELCDQLGFQTGETAASPQELSKSSGVFLSLTSAGVIPASELDGTPMPTSGIVTRLALAYQDALHRETSTPGSAGD